MTQYDSGPYSTNIFSGDGGQIKFRTATGTSTQTTRMTITAAGNVGIGITDPAVKLTVFTGGASAISGTNDGIRLQVTSYDNSARNTIAWHQTGSDVNLGRFGLEWNNATTQMNFVWRDVYNSGVGVSELMRLQGNGNLGIGTTSPDSKLHIETSASNPFRMVRTGGSATNFGYEFGSGAIGLYDYTNSSYRYYITSGGNVGIGTTAPNSRLSVNGGSFEFNRGTGALGNYYVVINKGASNDGGIILSRDNASDFQIVNQAGNGNLTFYSYGAASEVLTILRSNGNVGINNTNASYRLDVSGDARILSGSLGVGVAPNATDGRIDASNDIVAFQTSDRRLKENITPITNALEKVKSLTGVMFDWKEETKSVHGYEGHDVGIIAQDVQAVLPEAVRTNDTGYLSVRYEKMIALLIEGMKEQQLQIDELKSKLK
jgi:hypothetical protein